MSVSALNLLIEKTADWDKDERYMATNDLCALLIKDIKMDENMEQRICAAILKQLDDTSNDVQSVAVKCLAIILKKVQQAQIGEICKKLCSLILDGKDALRDIYSIGLKTLIVDVPEGMGALVCTQLTGKLLIGTSKDRPEEIVRECLDNLSELLRRFGHLNENEHADIMKTVVLQLENERPVIRKRAANCLGSLAVVSNDGLLNKLIQTLLEKIELSEKTSSSLSSQETRTLIQTIGTISRTVGYRLGRHLDKIVPLFLRFCGDPNDESLHNDTANELRENCFPGLESFVTRCTREVAPFLSNIIEVSIAFMKYDPNYSYDDDNVDEDGSLVDMTNEDDEEEEQFEDEDFGMGSDDDDTSWKVRKAAVKVISAIISARPEMLHDIYSKYGDDIISRFKEREENVRLDIISCFTNLVQVTTISPAASGNTGHISSSRPSPLIRQRSYSSLLEGKINYLVVSCCQQLNGSSVKAKSLVFLLLKSVVIALNGGLDSHVQNLIRAVEKALLDKNQTLKLDALVFFRQLLDSHKPHLLQPYIPKLITVISPIVNEDWYKIIAEALRVFSSIIAVIRPKDITNNSFINSYDYKPLVLPLYSSIFPRLEALDIDQEIKECAILTTGKLFYHLGDNLASQLPTVLALLHKRLDNETTRIATLKTLTMIASSPIVLDLSPLLTNCALELAQFLRQNSRTLKQLTLQTLDAIITSPSTPQFLNIDLLSAILQESSSLINDTDLHLANLSLKLCLSCMQHGKNSPIAEPLFTFIYPKLVSLAKSSLIQGVALQSLIKVLQELSICGYPKMEFADIFVSLYSKNISSFGSLNNNEEITKHSLSNLSKSIAGVCSKLPPHVHLQTTQQFLNDLSATNESLKQLALLCLGEIGQYSDLSNISELKNLILNCFESPSEDTKLAAAYALGHIAVGNMQYFLPLVLSNESSTSININTRHQYLLLAALKEVIILYANKNLDFESYLPQVLPILLNQCQSEEESVRNMVAECFGVLTAMNSSLIIPVLLNLIIDINDKLKLRMIANTLRFALSRNNIIFSSLQALTDVMENFLPLIQDEDLEVKKATLLMINTAVHHYVQTVEKQLANLIIPELLSTLKIRLERTVDLGPFKHKVDDNLPLRKVALTCLETIVDTTPDRLDVVSVMQVMPDILSDKDEIKIQTYQKNIEKFITSFTAHGVR
eukprot:gene6809-9325_t